MNILWISETNILMIFTKEMLAISIPFQNQGVICLLVLFFLRICHGAGTMPDAEKADKDLSDLKES